MNKIIKSTEFTCKKFCGGARPLWHARHPAYNSLVGAGNTADNAIRDFRKQLRAIAKRKRSNGAAKRPCAAPWQ